jgi:hypothetical protein
MNAELLMSDGHNVFALRAGCERKDIQKFLNPSRLIVKIA